MTYQAARSLLIFALLAGIITLLGVVFAWLQWEGWTVTSIAVFAVGIMAIITSIHSLIYINREEKMEWIEQEAEEGAQVLLFETKERAFSRIDGLVNEVTHRLSIMEENAYSPQSAERLSPKKILEEIRCDLDTLLLFGDLETAQRVGEGVRESIRHTPWAGEWAHLLESNEIEGSDRKKELR